MSTLSQFAPFAGGGIKSIQTGAVSAAMTGGGGGALATSNFTISAVTIAKSIPEFQGVGRSGGGGASDGINMASVLTTTTNLQVNQYTFYSNWILYGRWYVVESN